jgi:uncharacterized membrane protein
LRTERARGVAIAAGVSATAALVAITLRQIGVVEHLPDPPGDVWDSDGIVMSKAAHPFGIPDGMLGLASYAVTVGLLARGSSVVRVKLVCDAGAAGLNAVRQVVSFRKVCSWCMVAAVCTVPVVLFGWKAADAS